MLLAVSPSARPVPLRVILTMILVRISIHKAKNGTDHSKSRNAPKIIGGRKAGKFIPGRKARFAGKEPRLGTDNEDRVVEAGCQNRFLKRKMLKQVQTNLWANSENGGPLTDNVVLKSVQRFLDFKRTAVL